MRKVLSSISSGAGLYITMTIMIVVAIALHFMGLDARANAIPLIMFGMADIKSMAAIREKWNRVTPTRTDDYQIGVKSPKRDWAAETTASAANYKAGVDAAQAKGMFAKGVANAGTKKWQEKALAKGPGRFAEGVSLAGPDYEKGFAPFRAAIAAVDLGPKFPRRDPRNLDRVKKVVTALSEAKMGK